MLPFISEAMIEAVRRHCEDQLGDQVSEVRSSVRDHGGTAGIMVRTWDGRRHAVAFTASDSAHEVAYTLQKWIDRR